MPGFCFQVLNVRKEDTTTIIRLIEIPEQNRLDSRPVFKKRVIWLDSNVHNEGNTKARERFEEIFSIDTFGYSDNADQAIELV